MRYFQRLCFCATLAWCLEGASHAPLLAAATTDGSSAPAHLKDVVPVIVEDEWTRAKLEMKNKTIALLAAENFAALDATARELRASQAAFANGYWRLSLFYWVLGDLEENESESDWQTRLGLLRRWFEGDPESITPRVTLAIALVHYAWAARGSGRAHEVTSEAWGLVVERLADADRILEAARSLPEKCPYWYSAWMVKAMLSQDSRERYDEIFAEAVRNFPSYAPFYFMKAWRLQERWYGAQGEWEDFAKESADRIGGETGDVLYAQILWYIHDARFYANPIGETAAEWPRAQRGFEAIRALPGFSPRAERVLFHQRVCSERRCPTHAPAVR